MTSLASSTNSRCALAVLGLVVALVLPTELRAADSTVSTIYDPDPNHLWNRLSETLFERTSGDGGRLGLDELDILYWATTKHLLAGPSHQEALAVLDEFIHKHGEKLIRDPLKRALLQRDLWELFDWSARPFINAENAAARAELQSRLAVVMRRLALTTNEVTSLPDNYALSETQDSPDLPRALFQTNGDWVSVGLGYEPAAPTHMHDFDGHSAFCVMLNVPGGRGAAVSYLQSLRAFARHAQLWEYRTNRFAWESTNEPDYVLGLNSKIPQFPTNTEWALVRRMLTIDSDGNIRPTPIIESIQMRRYFAFTRPKILIITNSNGFVVPTSIPPIDFFEFQMNRRRGLELRKIGHADEGFEFVHFRGKGIDVLESSGRNPSGNQQPRATVVPREEKLRTCVECHSAKGIYSVLSYTGFSFPPPTERPADFKRIDIAREIEAVTSWKQLQYDWGLLQGLWRRSD